MRKITKMIKKVAAHARRIALVGVAVGAYTYVSASDVTKVGPITEKAQLETVKVDAASVEAFVLAGTVAQVNAVFARRRTETAAEQVEVMKEPVIKQINTEFSYRNAMVAPVDFTIDPGTPVTNPDNWEQTDLNSCQGGPSLCGITFDQDMYPLDPDGKPNSFVLNQVNSQWASTPDGQQIGTTGIYVHRRN